MEAICTFFLLFIFYSFLGWIVEVIDILVETKKLVNRGFLIGPCCPIYGIGCFLMSFLLKKYLDDPVALFIMAVVICSLLEYFTSYIMEKFFKARWWDYSDKKFNINGRICLINLVGFGLLGTLMMYVVHPFVVNLIGRFPSIVLYILSGFLFGLFLTDFFVSFKVISGFRKTAKSTAVSIRKDSTEEITKKVRETLNKKGWLYARLMSAFQFTASELLLGLKKTVKNGTMKVKNGTIKATKTLVEQGGKIGKKIHKKSK